MVYASRLGPLCAEKAVWSLTYERFIGATSTTCWTPSFLATTGRKPNPML